LGDRAVFVRTFIDTDTATDTDTDTGADICTHTDRHLASR